MSNHYQDFISHPTGAIAKGAWCDCCKRFNNRKVTVSVVLSTADKQQLLFIQRATQPQEGWWALPGGYLDWDETIYQAGARELEEETGVSLPVTSFSLLEVFSSPTRDPDGRQNVDCALWGILDHAQLKLMGPQIEATQVKLFALSSLPEKIAFDHRRMIEVWQKSLKLPTST